VDTAIDCGTFVNPERIQSQIEGAAIMVRRDRQTHPGVAYRQAA
jgi:hypothetical protein